VTQTASALDALVERALDLDKWAVARLVRLFEDTRHEAIAQRVEVIEALEARGRPPRAFIAGLTGTPGAGKSTLVGEIGARLIQRSETRAVAALAIDPTSQRSGGAILGDRTRVRFPTEERRLYFRSQASERNLGGIGRNTYPVVRLLERLFDIVLIETVGIGQSEIEVEQVSDRVYLVLQPMGGDQIQFMKAGIMEVPDVFVLNKADAGAAARRTYHTLRSSIDFARPGETEPPQIIQTSAITGAGLDELVDDMEQHIDTRRSASRRARYFLEKWIDDEYGRLGLQLLEQQGGADALLSSNGTFEAAQAAYRPPVAAR